MNRNLNAIGKKIHRKLDISVDRLKATQEHLSENQKETLAVTNLKLDGAKQTLIEKKRTAANAGAVLVNVRKRQMQELPKKIAVKKVSRDSESLEKQAKNAEIYAEACVEMTLYYAAESEVAILEAVALRREIDEAKNNKIRRIK